MMQMFARAFEGIPQTAKAWAATFVVEASLAALGLKRTLRWMETVEPTARSTKPSDEVVRRDARTVSRAYRLSPFPGTCLRRSLVQYWLARRAGLAVDFVIGVRSLDAIQAHAWVENGSATSDSSGDDFSVILRSPPSASPQRAAPSAHELCLACGLCCDGTLFGTVRVQPEEVARLPRRLQVVGSPSTFAQPCAALGADGRCDIYEGRPKSCRDFRCRVLERYLTGELTERQARSTIQDAKALAASIRASASETTKRIPLRRLLDERLGTTVNETVESRRENAALLINAKLLDMLLKAEMLPREDDIAAQTAASHR